MSRKIFSVIFIISAGITLSYFVVNKFFTSKNQNESLNIASIFEHKGEVIGFLPYWLLTKANQDYSEYINTLTYFSLSVNSDGTIQKYTNPGESEPGYLALKNGKFDSFLTSAKEKKVNLSLAVFCSDDEVITQMLENPEESAKNLINDITPLIDQYRFADLNLDIEQVKDASPEARLKFTDFVKEVRNNLPKDNSVTLSIDISASAFVKDTNLSDPKALAPIVDKIIIMAYDYHYIGSSVTGPVAPLEGAGIVSEFDTQAAVEAALEIVPKEKIILGIPLYGYEWEAIENVPRSAVIPGTGMIISNQRAENFLYSCATCSAVFDNTDKENYIIYKDQETGTYHHVFYPSEKSTQYKIKLAKQNSLGGIALWALGYEGETILEPLSSYHN